MRDIYTGDKYGDFETGVNFATGPGELAGHQRFIELEARPRILAGYLRDAYVLGGYRKSAGSNDQDDYVWAPRFHNVRFGSSDPCNENTGWKGDGTQWGMRAHGIRAGRFVRCRARDFFGTSTGSDGAATTNEGHAWYLTLSPASGHTLTFKSCKVFRCGGHGIYLTTAYDGTGEYDSLNPYRVGRAIQPEHGGHIVVNDCVLVDTDQSEGRGAFALNFPDVFSTIHINRTVVRQNIPSGYRKGSNWYASRAGLSAVGTSDGIYITDSTFSLESPSDRTNQVSIRGPEFAVLDGCHFDCDNVAINSTGHGTGWHEGLPLTKKLTIRNCTGRARVVWNNEVLGEAATLNGTWTLPEALLVDRSA